MWHVLPRRFERNLDHSRHTARDLARLIHEHVEAGGRVREQDNPSGYDAEVWYSVTIVLEHREVFFKFILEPDNEDDPGILIVSIRPDGI